MSVRRLGVTKLHTRRQKITWRIAGVATLLVAAAALWVGVRAAAWLTSSPAPYWVPQPVLTGPGGSLFAEGNSLQFPLRLETAPVTWWLAGPITVAVFMVVFRLTLAPVFRAIDRDPRRKNLPAKGKVRRKFSAFQVRRDSKFTAPGLPWWYRWTLPASALGYTIGTGTNPKAGRLWLSFNRRLRIVAHSGWGKTHRLLIPIIRALPGAALVSSVEPDIFLATVKARETRWWNGRPRRLPIRVKANPLTGKPAHWARPQRDTFPVYVIDCLPEAGRVTTGYPGVRWNPIPGCEDYHVALRRAESLVKGLDDETSTGSDGTARWFEEVCTDVIAAWFHAAAFDPGVEISDIATWLNDSNLAPCENILRMFPTAPQALTNLRKLLNPTGGRTTANVEAMLARALGSLQSTMGQQIIGSRNDEQFDVEGLIHDRGTLYLLANPDQMKLLCPLLSLIAGEVCGAAEAVALAKRGRTKRLDMPFFAVLDELRYGVRVARLPYMSNVTRKYGVHYITTEIDESDSEDLYGAAAAGKLRTNATSVYAAPDVETMKRITAMAGEGAVVTAQQGQDTSDSIAWRDVLTLADAQDLQDGDMIVVTKGCRPFLAHVASTFERRRLRRQISREAEQVTGVAA